MTMKAFSTLRLRGKAQLSVPHTQPGTLCCALPLSVAGSAVSGPGRRLYTEEWKVLCDGTQTQGSHTRS